MSETASETGWPYPSRDRRTIEDAKELLGDRYCLARQVERVRREIPAFLRLVSTETLIAELDRRRKLV